MCVEMAYHQHRKQRLIDAYSRKCVGWHFGNHIDYAESFIKTLKVEEVYQTEYESYRKAYEGIGKFIDLYNRKHLHSSLGYVSPDEFEKGLLNQKALS
jgi:putative transposase